jgi:hypothetical protein
MRSGVNRVYGGGSAPVCGHGCDWEATGIHSHATEKQVGEFVLPNDSAIHTVIPSTARTSSPDLPLTERLLAPS